MIKSLSESDWTDTRKDAVKALVKMRENTNDDNLILGYVADSNDEIRKTAVDAAATMKLGPQNVAVLKTITEDNNWAGRREAVTLLAKIQTPASNELLIQELSDQDDDVSHIAMKGLMARPVSEADLPALSNALKSTTWSVRLDAVKLISRISGVKAGSALIPMLNDDDQDITKAVETELMSRTIYDSYIPDLGNMTQSTTWTARLAATKLLGRLKSPEAAKFLIAELQDSDEDVSKEAFALLKSRTLSGPNVDDLIATLSSTTWTARQRAAEMLGNSGNGKAIGPLNEAAKNEIDEDVTKTMQAAVKKLSRK